MKNRKSPIIDTRKKKASIVLVGFILALVMATGFVLVFASTPTQAERGEPSSGETVTPYVDDRYYGNERYYAEVREDEIVQEYVLKQEKEDIPVASQNGYETNNGHEADNASGENYHNEINRFIDENRFIDDELIELMAWYFDLMQQAENTYFYFHVHPTGIRGFDEFQLDRLKSLYHALNENFNYILIQDHQFAYIGYFSGDERFINQPPFPIEGVNFRNRRATRGDNIYFYVTPIRGIQLGQSLVSYFEDQIAIGRNFSAEDFYLRDHNDEVNVLLGFNYIGVYELGDTISLELYAGRAAFNFRVIGFFEYGVRHSHMTAFFATIYFDNAVVVPFFEITHEPTCDNINLLNKSCKTNVIK